MKHLATTTTLGLALIACAPEQPQQQQSQAKPALTSAQQQAATAMEVSRNATRQPSRGPAEWFTGTATITPLFDAKGASQVGAARVRFERGARTAWHKHPLGQRLVILEGEGWTQVEGGPVEAISAGDVVWCPPDVRHWHGATPTTAMAHIAIQESEDGSPVTWLEHVPEADYRKGPAKA